MKKIYVFAFLKSLKKGVGSRVGSRSRALADPLVRVWIRGSGSAPKCKGSPTLLTCFLLAGAVTWYRYHSNPPPGLTGPKQPKIKRRWLNASLTTQFATFPVLFSSVVDPHPTFHLNKDPNPNQCGSMEIRILVGLCRHKMLDFDMKNIPYSLYGR